MKIILILVLLSQIVLGQELPKSNQLVLEYAKNNLGKKVGDGVCVTLTNRALRNKDEIVAPKRVTKMYLDGKIGKKVKDGEHVIAGDIVRFVGVKYFDGDNCYSMKNHIGIVKEVKEGVLYFYEQNSLDNNQITFIHSRVVESKIDERNVVCGNINFYRPK